jgi:hypothetical protein
MCRRAGTQLAFTVFAAAKGKDETAGKPEFHGRTRFNSRVSGNSKADFYDLLGVDTKNWFDLGCHMTAGMA